MRLGISIRQHSSTLLLILLCGLLFAGGLWHWLSSMDSPQVVTIPCADISQGCGNPILNVITDTKPQVMKAFDLRLNLDNPHVDAIDVDFAMQGMAMGLNRYHLIPKSTHIWVAQVMLPVCIQGRSDWLMQISLNQEGKKTRYQLQFQADR